MILNFYLGSRGPRGRLRDVERDQERKVKILLKRKGVQNTVRLEYSEAIALLAQIVRKEIDAEKSVRN